MDVNDIYISNIPGGDGSKSLRTILTEHLKDYLAHIGQIEWLKVADVQKQDRDRVKTRVGFLRMTDRRCHQAVIDFLDGKLYTFQDDERVLHASFSKNMPFEYYNKRPELIHQTAKKNTITSTTTAASTDPLIPGDQIEELNESVRRLKRELNTTDFECSVLASELYKAQEESAALRAKCSALEEEAKHGSVTPIRRRLAGQNSGN